MGGEQPSRLFGYALGVFEVTLVLLYAFCTTYSSATAAKRDSTNTTTQLDAIDDQLHITAIYATFQDVHVMIFVGFGFLMTFLSKYGFSAVGLNFVLSALSIQWGMLLYGFWLEVDTNDRWTDVELDLHSLIEGDFAAGAVAITFGAVLGKVSPVQMLAVVFMELFFYSLNLYVGARYFLAVDIGGSMFIHSFGAYFGVAMAFVLGYKGANPEPKNHNESNKTSDTFAMIGTLFLWMFWPSFNGALAPTITQERVFLNTVLALTGSCIGAFMWSNILRRKFSMVDIQNATLAGGVAVGSSADLSIDPWAAILIGFIAATVSTFGYVFLTPFLEKHFRIHDTCGVHNLHGLPGIIGGISGTIAAGTADEDLYGRDSIGILYPARTSHDRSAGEQAGYQFLALTLTVAIALASGAFTAGVVSLPMFEPPQKQDYFSDHRYWDEVEDPLLEEGHDDTTNKNGDAEVAAEVGAVNNYTIHPVKETHI